MRSSTRALLLGASLFLALPAQAADAPAAPVADLTGSPAGDYKIDSAHTNVIFYVSHLGFSRYVGRFDKIEGVLQLDPKNPESSKLDVTIDAASVDVNNDKLEGELKKAAFNVGEFPKITFKSTKLEQKDATHGEVTGDLTLLGVTKPVTLSVTLNGAGPHPMNQKQVVGFSATGAIKRSDFGMKNWLPMVGDDVNLIIESELHQAP